VAFDIVIEFHEAVVRDVQIRMLNRCAATNLWVDGPSSRIVYQPMDPLQIKACWNDPSLTIDDDGVRLSAAVQGGARQPTGRILKLDGEVSARGSAVVDADGARRPYLRVRTSGPLAMHKLKVSYPGSPWPSFAAGLDPAKELTSLRPVLASQLFLPLSSIPLTYVAASLPIAMSPDEVDAGSVAPALPVKLAVPVHREASSSVALGLMVRSAVQPPSTCPSLLSSQHGYNAAVGISEHGTNTLLDWLCRTGAAAGELRHSRLGPIAWRWDSITVKYQHGQIRLAGVLVQGTQPARVRGQLRCRISTSGELRCTLLSDDADATINETVLASWRTLLARLLAAPITDDPGGVPSDGRLSQRFELPGTDCQLSADAEDLVVQNGQIVAYYTVPQTPTPLPLEIPPRSPGVAITQPVIPHQSAPRAPVNIALHAEIANPTSAPYEYVWSTDLSPEPASSRDNPTTIITGTPAASDGTGLPQPLTTVHLNVIDIFGQSAQAHGPALYVPAASRQDLTQDQQPRTRQEPPPRRHEPDRDQAPGARTTPRTRAAVAAGAGIAILIGLCYGTARGGGSAVTDPTHGPSPVVATTPGSPSPDRSTQTPSRQPGPNQPGPSQPGPNRPDRPSGGRSALPPLQPPEVTPAQRDFLGLNITPGLPSAYQAFTIANRNDRPVTMSAALIRGDSAFSVSDDRCVAKEVKPDEQCQVTVRFDPTSIGPKVGSLEVSDSGGRASAAALTGIGFAKLTVRAIDWEDGSAAGAHGQVTDRTGRVNCHGTCRYTISDPALAEIILTAKAYYGPGPDGYVFRDWQGPCSGGEPNCTFRFTRDTTVTAWFEWVVG